MLIEPAKILQNGDLVFPKTQGVGIKSDIQSPVFGWKDLVGQIVPRPSGGPAPSLNPYRGTNILTYAFAANDVIDNIVFHMPHDYVPGTDIFIHHHWGHNGTAISGSLAVDYFVQYCKGYNQAGQTFNSELTVPLSVSTPDVATFPRYGHFIQEIQISNAGGDATHLDRGLLEVDGLIIVGFKVITIPTITGGTPNQPFIFMVDIHYQSTQVATKNRNYPFYT